MSHDARRGPELDSIAQQELQQEEQEHRRILKEIEAIADSQRPELYAREDERHLKRLSQIYGDLADRQIRSEGNAGRQPQG